MDPLLFYALLGAMACAVPVGVSALLGVLFLFFRHVSRTEAQEFALRVRLRRDLQGVLGLTAESTDRFRGRSGELEVVFELSEEMPQDVQLRYTTLHVALQGRGLRVTTGQLANNVRLGDPAFDKCFELNLTDEGVLHLTPALRRCLVDLADGARKVQLTHHGLSVMVRGQEVATVQAALARLTCAVEELAKPATAEAIVRSDPSPVMRRMAMLGLVKEDPAAARRVAVALLASGEDDLVVRTIACSLAEDDGALASVVQTVDDMLERGTDLGQSTPLRRPMVDAVVALEDPRLLPLAVALSRIPSSELRRRLLPLFAAEGAVAHVPVLRALQEELGMLDGALEQAIERTIDQIQGRSHGQAGAVSVVEVHDAGQLAVAEAPEDAWARARPHAAKPTREA